MKSSGTTYLPFRNSVHFTQAEAQELMSAMLSGAMDVDGIVEVLQFLRRKGETLAEIVGFATALRAHATPLALDQSEHPLVDTCGTGGDGTNTFNISTATAFVVAGTGVRVAKHGNRRISSQCGSADVLEELGVRVSLPAVQVKTCIEGVGIGFFYAPLSYPAMQHVAEARARLRGRTIFNLLGPLSNPVGTRAQLIGAYSVRAAELLAQAAARLGIERALVVHGADGLDEITTTTYSTVFKVGTNGVEKERWYPEDFDLPVAAPEDLLGGSPAQNAGIIRSLLEPSAEGEDFPRPVRDIVVANAAAALLVAQRASDFQEAVAMALESIASGAALQKLHALVECTNDLNPQPGGSEEAAA